MLTKKAWKIVGAVSVVLFFAVNLFIINLKPILYNQIKEYNENAVLFEYTNKSYEGITIPDDVRVFFAKDIQSLNRDFLSLILDKENKTVYGIYNPLTKEITLLYDRDVKDIKNTLRHELAHHDYYTILTKTDKNKIKSRYGLFCKNSIEFYANTIRHYGFFNFD